MLPAELFFEIARHLDLAELKAARLSSKTLAAVTAPFLFRRLVVAFDSYSLHRDRDSSFRRRHSFLTALAERTTQLGKHVKSLTIHEPFEDAQPPKTIANLPLRALRSLSLKKKPIFSEEIVKLLCRALPHLDSLYELRWSSSTLGSSRSTSSAQRQEHVVPLLKVLSAMPSIRELSYFTDLNCFLEQYFCGFHNLTRLYYSGDCPVTLLPAIISHSPKLRSLTLQHVDLFLFTRHKIDVANLFPVPKEPHASLESLELRNVIFTENSVTILIPYIQKLRVLSILDSDVAGLFWHQSSHNKILIQFLDLKRVLIDEHVLNYLSKYRGLYRLHFEIAKDGMVDDREQQVAGASRFWFGVLPLHAPVLTYLEIISRTPGHWCIQVLALEVISECQHLKHLLLTVDLARAIEKGPSNVIRRILHLVSLNTWPCLRKLGLFSVPNEVVRAMSHPRHGFAEPKDYGAYKIDEAVESVRFESWSKFLAELEIVSFASWSYTYTFMECEDGSGKFVYHGLSGDEFRHGWKWVEDENT